MRAIVLVGLSAALCCGLVGCDFQPRGGSPPAPGPPPPDGKDVDWPAVEGFVRDEIHRFDDPRLGYSVAYHAPAGLAATVYVYDGGIASIPAGASEVARAELAKASDDVLKAQRRGMWKSVEGGEPREARLGSGPGAPAAWAASFRLTHADGEALSDLFVTGRNGKFVKVRCTFPAARKADSERDRDRLLDALGAALGS